MRKFEEIKENIKEINDRLKWLDFWMEFKVLPPYGVGKTARKK